VWTKLKTINAPDKENVHALWRERVTSHGMNESSDATEAPRPNKTSSEGRAQHIKVLRDVNNEK